MYSYTCICIIVSGNCFAKALVGFIEVPANDSYALIGCNKTLSFQFNFTGNHVTTFILVNNKSHLIKDLSIHHTKHHHINLERCIEDFNLTLLTVNHMYSNNYTLYLSTSDNFNRSDLQYSFYLRKLLLRYKIICSYAYVSNNSSICL